MDKIECRAIIIFFVREGSTPNDIHSKFIKVYGDSSPSFSTIKYWAAKFKRGCASQKLIHVKNVQKVRQHQKTLNKCTIRYWMTGKWKCVKFLRL